MSIRYISGITIFFTGIFGAIWVFNHINAWLGFLAFGITILTAYTLLKSKPPKDNDKDENSRYGTGHGYSPN